MEGRGTERLVKQVMEGLVGGKIDRELALQLLKGLKQSSQSGESEEVAIIGMAMRMPGASTPEQYWEIISNQADCIGTLSESRRRDVDAYLRHVNGAGYDPSYIRAAFLDEVDRFDYRLFRLSPREAALMDPCQRLFLQTVWHAIEDAGYGGRKLTGTRTGVYLGFATYPQGNYGRMAYDVDPQLLTTGMVGNIPALTPSRISYLLDLKGPTMVVDTACSSSLVTVHLACQALRNGDCQMAIAGGLRVNLLPFVDENLKFGVESDDGTTRAFDEGSGGSGVGEGAGAVILKPLSAALRDGDQIYAVIKGTAINQDGSSIGITAPNPAAQEDVITAAWKHANIHPETIQYIEAHGTGTRLGDPIELDGLERAFSRFTAKKQFCAVSSVKTNIGHLFECAGVASLIKAVLALKHAMLPPTIHFDRPNQRADFANSPVYVNTRLRPWKPNDHPRRCGVSSFGLSGTNCHVVLEEFTPPEAEPTTEGPDVLTLSARTPHVLADLVASYRERLAANPALPMRSVCYTSNSGRGHYGSRVVLVVQGVADAVERLKQAENALRAENPTPDGPAFYYGEHKVVPESKKADKAQGELTERERMQLTEAARQLVERWHSTGASDEALLHELSRLYVQGADVDWERFYQGRPIRKVSLPGYPFERERCWIEIPEPVAAEAAAPQDGLFYTVRWAEQPLGGTPDPVAADSTYLLLRDPQGLSDQVARALTERGALVLQADPAGAPADWERLLGGLGAGKLAGVVHLGTLAPPGAVTSLQELEQRQDAGVRGLFHLLRALAGRGLTDGLTLLMATNLAYAVTGSEPELKPENAAMPGFAKAVAREHPELKVRALDLDHAAGAAEVVAELLTPTTDFMAAYRGGRRYVEEFAAVEVPRSSESGVTIKPGGVYVITGGAGGIGLETAAFFASRARVGLALINRTPMPDRSEWDRILASETGGRLARRIRRIQEIEAAGSQVLCLSADVARPEEVERALAEVRTRFGRIDGLVHGAGLPQHDLIASRESGAFAESVFNCKVAATWLLDQATAADPLDFFVLFSSVATIFPAAGQGEYAAANAFLDAYAAYRNQVGRRTLTVNWTTWKEVGMAAEGGFTVDTLFKTISTSRAIDGLAALLDAEGAPGQVLVGEMNFDGHGPVLWQRAGVRLAPPLQARVEQVLAAAGKTLRAPQAGRRAHGEEVRLTGRTEGEYTALERAIATTWGEVLGFGEVNVYDNYFELGGDSISGLKIANALAKVIGRQINPADLLTYTTVTDLARHLQATGGTDTGQTGDTGELPPLVPVAKRAYYPVSPSQRGLYLLEQLEDVGTSYNVPNVQVIDGELDLERFREAVRNVVAHHESLRTSFDFVDGEPVQIIHDSVEIDVEVLAIPECADEQQAMVHAREAFARFLRPFDLRRAPLLRCGVGRLSPRRFMVIYDLHHIVTDGITLEILGADFLKSYRGEELAPLPIQYKDYAVWMNDLCQSDFIRRQEAYWLERFAGEVPVLDLPTDFPRPPFQQFDGGHVRFELTREQTEALQRLVRETGTTLYIMLLSVFNVLLWKYSRQEDIVVGTPVVGRLLPELEPVAGMLVNTLLLRNQPAGEKRFREFLDDVRANSIEAFANQYYPYAHLVERLNVRRDLSRNPLFDVMFVLQNYGVGESGWDADLGTPVKIDANLFNAASKFDISIAALEAEGTLSFDIEYSAKLFREESMQRLAGHFVRIVEQVTRDPGLRLAEIDVTTAAERDEVLGRFNATALPYDTEATVQALFEEQAARTPEREALLWRGGAVSYGALNSQANSLAGQLRTRGVGPGSLVAVMLERSPAMIAAVLGVLKAGAGYLPVDPTYPPDRIRYMLADSGAVLLLTENGLRAAAPFEGEVLCLEELTLDASGVPNPAPVSGPADVAYVIYTSGSTGKPKGTVVENRNVVAYMQAFQHEFGPLAEETVLQTASFSFDTFVEEVYPVLCSGGRLVIPEGMEFLDMERLGALVRTHGVTLLSTTPLLLGEINAAPPLESVRTYISGGDVLKPAQVSNLVRRARVYNTYGPTETTVCATYGRYTGSEEGRSIPIGRPIANYRAYVLDGDGHPLPVGVPGELFIAGAGVARGYLNRPELTEERFLPDPFVPGARMYRTGDLVRWLPDGSIEFVGRADRQVKIRGFRVELGEVERCLSRHPAVSDAVVSVYASGAGKALVAYVVSAEADLSAASLREHLRQELPDYMVPARFVVLEALPTLPNGKVDWRALPAPDDAEFGQGGPVYEAPRTEVERQLAAIWSEVLRVGRVSIHDNFFELGGDSILSIQVVSRARAAGLHLAPKLLYQYQTIAELAPVLGTVAGVEAEQGPVTGEVALTPVEHWFFEQNPPEVHHWNQSAMLEVRLAVDPALLERAIGALLEHHDALRLRFQRTDAGWRQVCIAPDGVLPFEQVDLSDVPDAEFASAIEAKASQVQASLDLTAGPLLRAVWFHAGAGRSGRLLLVVHHLAVDGVSWRILAEDLQTAYGQLSRGEAVRLPAKTTSYQQWASKQAAYAQTEPARQEAAYWKAVGSGEVPRLPVDGPGGPNTAGSEREVLTVLSREETRVLLQDLPATSQARIDEVLLAALAQTVHRWAGGPALVTMEGHGREEIVEGVDLSRTVGWFTALFPLRLDLGKEAESLDAAGVLQRVVEQVRSVPRKGIGYGILRYLCEDQEIAAALRAQPQPEITFNYLGQLDQSFQADGLFGPAREPIGPGTSRDYQRTSLLGLNGIVIDGRLELAWKYSPHWHTEETVAWLAAAYLENLRVFIHQGRSGRVDLPSEGEEAAG